MRGSPAEIFYSLTERVFNKNLDEPVLSAEFEQSTQWF